MANRGGSPSLIVIPYLARAKYDSAGALTSKTDDLTKFGPQHAVDDATNSALNNNFLSGGSKRPADFMFAQITMTEEVHVVGVEVTAIGHNSGADTFKKTHISVGNNPTTLAQNADPAALETHNPLIVEYEGPASKGEVVHIIFDKPIKGKYVFLQADLGAASYTSYGERWGFSEVRILTGEESVTHCMTSNPLNGVTMANKKSVRKLNQRYQILFFLLAVYNWTTTNLV